MIHVSSRGSAVGGMPPHPNVPAPESASPVRFIVRGPRCLSDVEAELHRVPQPTNVWPVARPVSIHPSVRTYFAHAPTIAEAASIASATSCFVAVGRSAAGYSVALRT